MTPGGCSTAVAALALLALGCGGGEDLLAPDVTDDGWTTATPAEMGLDEDLLRQADEFASGFPTIYSFLIARRGQLVFERYYHGSGRDDRPSMRSVTKSISSVAFGIALDRGDLAALDQRVDDVLPEYFTPADTAKRRITVRHLLTMTSGLNSDLANPVTRDTSWVRAYIESPLQTEPGTQFRYDGSLVHILSVMLTRATGMTLADYARQHVFEPLGIRDVQWASDPQGFTTAASGIGIRARDMAKIGQILLKGGSWSGTPIVSSAWVGLATRNEVPGGSADAGYGFLWWITSETGHSAFHAAGYGGQYIYVIPDLEIVVVITGDPGISPDQPIFHKALVTQFVVPAVRN
ncbi:MAG: serine hydrolase [Gemmatimonadota bacterium]|jgi:CubicO group peptidase (beta-lactamase class C family)